MKEIGQLKENLKQEQTERLRVENERKIAEDKAN